MSDRARSRPAADRLPAGAARGRARAPMAQSLPSSLRLAASSLGGDLVRMRSFFLDVDGVSAEHAHARGPSASAHSLVPAPDAANATTRLEVLKAPEVNFTIFSPYGATLFALVYVIVVSYFARASWEEDGTLEKGPVLSLVSSLLRGLVQLAFLVLPVLFALRLAVSRRVANEQIWTAALLFTGLVCENPLTDLLSSLRTLRRSTMGGMSGSDAVSLVGVSGGGQHAARLVLYDATYTVVIYLYMLLSAHSYRILNAADYNRGFYLPKLLAGSVYFVVKLGLGYAFRVAMGVVPFSRLLIMYYLQNAGRASFRLAFPILVTTVVDSVFAMWVVREVSATAYFLARVPYLENRAKQLGFRCFVFQSVQLVINMLVVSVLLEASLPRGVLYRSYDWAVGHEGRFIQIEPAVGQLALAVIYLTWNVTIAYVNLPPGPIFPYSAAALRNLSKFFPDSLTDRRRWPLWMPFAVAAEPPDVDTESDDEQIPMVVSSVDGVSVVVTPQHVETLGVDGIPQEPVQDAAPAADSWRAGIPGGEACPLRYRHREWHEAPAIDCLSGPSLSGPRGTFLANPMYSGELEVNEDPSLNHTSMVSDGRLSREQNGANGDSLVGARSASVPIGSPVGRFHAPIAVSPQTIDRIMGSPHVDGVDEMDFIASLTRAMSPPPALACSTVGRGRLLTRKNVFVMETQVMMANAMYLCYIPGNRSEELSQELRSGAVGAEFGSSGHSDMGSHADNLDDLEAQIEAEKRATAASRASAEPFTMDPSAGPERRPAGRDWELEHDLGTGSNTFPSGIRPVSSIPNVAEADRQPEYDDGSMFLVDPVEMASKHGYLLYRHIRHDASNGHAIVLVGPDRVIVAFSGTRDRKNWVTNSRFMRAPWDEMFRHFDSEPSDTHPDTATDPTVPETSSPESNAAASGSSSPLPPDVRTTKSSIVHSKVPFDEPWGSDRMGDTPGSFAKAFARRHSTSAQGLRETETTDMERVQRSNHSSGRGSSHSLVQTEETPLMRRSRSVESLNFGLGLSSFQDADPTSSAPSSYGSVHKFKPGGVAQHRSGRRFLPRKSWLQALSQPVPRPGASEFEDVAVSLAREFATYGHSKVHLGFAQAYGKLRNRVMGALVELYGGKIGEGNVGGGPMDSFASRCGPEGGPAFERDADGRIIGVERGSCRGLPLFFVGHSLGGVLATFASYEAARYYRRIGLRRRQDVACTTFGSPMPGNTVFKQRYERMVETHWRFEFASDPVAKLPGIFNYTPVGVRVLLDQSGWLLVDPSLVEVQWWGRLAGPYLGVRLHIRASYIKALQVFCSRHKEGEDPLTECFWPFPITCQTRNLFPTE